MKKVTVLLLLSLFLAAPASAIEVLIRWTQENAEIVDGWTIHQGLTDTSFPWTTDVPKFTPNAQGIYELTFTIGPDTRYVGITAYNTNGVSLMSNLRAFPPSGIPVAPVQLNE